MDGMEAVEEVDRVRGVMESTDEGLEDYNCSSHDYHTSNLDRESYSRLSEDGTSREYSEQPQLDSRLSTSMEAILMGFDGDGFVVEWMAMITLSPVSSSCSSFVMSCRGEAAHKLPAINTTRFLLTLFITSTLLG